jgi:glucose/arabinose dehydrogenase
MTLRLRPRSLSAHPDGHAFLEYPSQVKRRLWLFAFLVVTLLLPACGDDSGGDLQEPGPPPVAEVTVEAEVTTISVGQTVQLTATPLDANGNVLEDRIFEWATADAGVATVSEAGLVTGVAEGQAEISATTEEVTGSMAITILPSASPPPPPPPPPGSDAVGLQEITRGLAFPLYLTSPPDDDRLFVVEKGGAIRIIEDGVVLDEPFLDLSGRVSEGAEQGLLGMAFPPDYASSRYFVVHYTDLDGDTRVSLFRVSDDPNRADQGSESRVLTVQQPGPVHNGGQILFGPDGMLYVGLGDGGSPDGDDEGRGQSLDDLLGSVLRIDVTSGAGYTVPVDNPFVGADGVRPEIWSYGLRNPWRFSFDRGTGDLYIADVGGRLWEEVNRAAAQDGAGRGVNYGWSRMEGPECLMEGCDESGLTLPLLRYDHTKGCSVIGGYVYRGAEIPSIEGQYFYGDFCQGWVQSIRAEGEPGEPVDWTALRPGDNITSFGEDADGSLYILTASGGVFKIVAR